MKIVASNCEYVVVESQTEWIILSATYGKVQQIGSPISRVNERLWLRAACAKWGYLRIWTPIAIAGIKNVTVEMIGKANKDRPVRDYVT